MRALLRPLDLLAFLSMTPVPSDARTPHPGRVPPARRPIPGSVGRGLDRPLAASAAGPRPAITARRHVSSLKDRGRGLRGTEKRIMMGGRR